MTTATDMLAAYLAAETAILEGKEASVGDRRFRSEDLDKVIAGRREWEQRVAKEQAQASACKRPGFGGRGFSVARLDQ